MTKSSYPNGQAVDGCKYVEHQQSWRVVEWHYTRNRGVRQSTDQSTLMCAQCCASWRASGPWIADVPDFADQAPVS